MTSSRTTTSTGERKSEEDLDEAEREYQRLVPEYNQLVDYVQSVALKFSQLQEDFQDDQVCRSAQLLSSTSLSVSPLSNRVKTKRRRSWKSFVIVTTPMDT